MNFFRSNRIYSLILAVLAMAGFFSINVFPLAWHAYRHHQLKEQFEGKMLEGIDQRLVKVFELDEAQYASLCWVDDQEILVDGITYDVMGEKHNRGYTLLYALADADEEILAAEVEEMMEEEDASGQEENESPDLFPPENVSRELLRPDHVRHVHQGLRNNINHGLPKAHYVPPDALFMVA